MNAKKFVVLLLIGVVCANVGAIRQLKEGSNETKISITAVSKTGTTNGIGAQLNSYVVVSSSADAYSCSSENAKRSPNGPSGNASGCGSGHTSGRVIAQGPYARGSSRSTAFARSRADAAASPKGATASGKGAGGGTTVASGSVGGRP